MTTFTNKIWRLQFIWISWDSSVAFEWFLVSGSSVREKCTLRNNPGSDWYWEHLKGYRYLIQYSRVSSLFIHQGALVELITTPSVSPVCLTWRLIIASSLRTVLVHGIKRLLSIEAGEAKYSQGLFQDTLVGQKSPTHLNMRKRRKRGLHLFSGPFRW